MAVTKLTRKMSQQDARRYLGGRLRAVIKPKMEEAKLEAWDRNDKFRVEEFYESIGLTGPGYYQRTKGRTPISMEEFGRIVFRLNIDEKEAMKLLKLAAEVPLF